MDKEAVGTVSLCSLFEDDGPGDPDDGTFSFETDFLAVKENPDYLKILRTTAILNAQKNKLSQDIVKLEELKSKAMEDPVKVKDEILNSDLTFFSCNIPDVPVIDWSKYNMIKFNKNLRNVPNTKEPDKGVIMKTEDITEGKSEMKTRGKKCNKIERDTFNKLWTVEEQLRLEALLVEYPPEPVEFNRWRKIAVALGNRTPRQVCCRVQKYYKKLQEAGISPCGSQHMTASKPSSKVGHEHNRQKRLLNKPTTFSPGAALSEEDNVTTPDSELTVPHEDMSQWVEIFNVIKQDKLKPCQTKHFLYKCEVCDSSPIVGLRWECKTCSGESSVSFCNDCMFTMTECDPPAHVLTHMFKSFKTFTNPL